MKQNRVSGQSLTLTLWLIFFLIPVNVQAELNDWTYQQEKDRLTNLAYSFVRSPMPQRGLYDNIRLEIMCKQNKLQFVVDGNALIASQNRPFEMDYQIDRRSPVALKMNTFNDSKQRGYTDENVTSIITDMLSGQAIFVRITTMIKKVLTGSISLNGAEGPIKKVLSDCGISELSSQKAADDYSKAQFEEDFGKLTVEKQQQVLQRLKVIMQELK
jgi:hypothetical protein